VKSTELLSKSLGLFIKMRELAIKQRELVSDGQIDAFFDLSSQRERLQNEISANKEKYEGYMDNNRDLLTGQKTRAISMEIADVIQSIQDIDMKIEEFIMEKRGGLLSEIKGLRQGQKALKGYGGQSAKTPRFIDRNG